MAIPIDKIVRSRRTTISLEVTEDTLLVVRAPFGASEREIRAAVLKHGDWIVEKKREMETRTRAHPPKRFIEGESFLYLGVPYPLKIVPAQVLTLKFEGGFFLAENALHAAREVFEAWYRQAARQFIPDRAMRLARKTRLKPGRIGITGARKRWGSCAPSGNLNFAWRLIMAPPIVIDYVIIHELAHLVEKNHSLRFWKKVEDLMPDYKTHLRWLKENGRLLNL